MVSTSDTAHKDHSKHLVAPTNSKDNGFHNSSATPVHTSQISGSASSTSSRSSSHTYGLGRSQVSSFQNVHTSQVSVGTSSIPSLPTSNTHSLGSSYVSSSQSGNASQVPRV